MSSIEIFKRRIRLPTAMLAGFHSPPETLRDPLMVSQINKAIIYTHPDIVDYEIPINNLRKVKNTKEKSIVDYT